MKVLPGIFDAGFTSDSFQGLHHLIDSDAGMFYYYGSGTVPPCTEDVFWQVFSQPRAVNEAQYQFLYHQLVKLKDGRKVDKSATSPNDVFGNNREVKTYNVDSRGQIKYSEMGSLGFNKLGSINVNEIQ
jgi:hypothetical protein